MIDAKSGNDVERKKKYIDCEFHIVERYNVQQSCPNSLVIVRKAESLLNRSLLVVRAFVANRVHRFVNTYSIELVYTYEWVKVQ